MKTSRYMIMLFVLTCLAQWTIPAGMILKREKALRKGEVFLFKTAPVDPYDAFRGRFVALNFDAATVTNLPGATNLVVQAGMLARLERGEDGFARIVSLEDRLDADVAAIPVQVLSVYDDTVRLSLPFDRFYMEESLAPEAERLYVRNARGDTASNTYAVVRVYRHLAVLEDLIINGRPAVIQAMEQDGPAP